MTSNDSRSIPTFVVLTDTEGDETATVPLDIVLASLLKIVGP